MARRQSAALAFWAVMGWATTGWATPTEGVGLRLPGFAPEFAPGFASVALPAGAIASPELLIEDAVIGDLAHAHLLDAVNGRPPAEAAPDVNAGVRPPILLPTLLDSPPDSDPLRMIEQRIDAPDTLRLGDTVIDLGL